MFDAEGAVDGDPALARRWLGIYGELVAVTEALLEGAADRSDAVSHEARQHLLESEVRPLEARLAHLRRRQDRWSQRHEGLVGLQIDAEAGEIRYRGRVAEVTPRERQLLRFLMQRPGTFYPSRVLLTRAWHASYLSEEQVRTYVARLRRKLADLDLPCEVVTRRPQGYALVFR
jgi:DNA-binding response OmpR family regulator